MTRDWDPSDAEMLAGWLWERAEGETIPWRDYATLWAANTRSET